MSHPDEPATEPGTQQAEPAAKPLDIRQRHFAEELALRGLDHPYSHGVADAYERAGYEWNRGNAARLAADPRIRAEVKRIQTQAADLAGVHLGRILIEMSRIALLNLDDVVERGPGGALVLDKKGRPKIDYSAMTRDHFAAVARFDKDGVVFHDKPAALRELLRHVSPEQLDVKHSADTSVFELMRAIDGKTKGLPKPAQQEGAT